MTAVAMIGFARPDHTRRTLDAVRAARPEQLFLIADGPREGRPADIEACAAVREVMDGVDWDCEVHRRYAETNLGLDRNVETGLDWVFGQVDEAIIFEDDCVADPTFFEFCDELLERFRDDQRVWQISGNTHWVPRERFGEDSYRFAGWASIWGWATWADRWHQHRRALPRDHRGAEGHLPIRTVAADARPGLLVTRAGQRHFADAAVSHDVTQHLWDKQWWLTMLSHGGLAAVPAVNMVENIGFGEGASSAIFERKVDPAAAMPMPLRHPEEVAVDVEVERELELLLSRVGGRTAQLARRFITQPHLRSAARRLLHSRAAASATRVASRLIDRRATKGTP